MKQLCIFLTIFLLSFTAFSQIKVGDNVDTISPASLLELESTDQGVLLPRLTAAQRDAQGSWTEGHVIYNTTDSCFQFFDGNIWDCMVGASETIEDNPPGLRMIGDCAFCEDTKNDTIHVATLDPVNRTKTLDSTEVRNILNQDKCFIVTKMEDGSYVGGSITFQMPNSANYQGKTFSLFIEPNSNNAPAVGASFSVVVTTLPGSSYITAIGSSDNQLHYVSDANVVQTHNSTGQMMPSGMNCLRGIQITASAESWYTCHFTVCKD